MMSLLFLLILLSPQYGVRISTGLIVKLIHLTSPESPFYNHSHTQQERLQELVSQSIARAHSFASIIKHNNSASRRLLRVRPSLRAKSQKGILVDVQVGTFQRRTPNLYYLDMDTASELTWLQCEGCKERNKCFPQRGEPFPNSRSTSYAALLYGHHNLCYPNLRIGSICSYNTEYKDGLQSMGFLSSESFTFMSNSGGVETVPYIVFGCGIDNEGPALGEEAGIFGLGWGPRSIVSQLRSQTNEQFSYCFPHLDQSTRATRSYLTFGGDINYSGGGFQQTPLVQVAAYEHYYLRLEGIAAAGQRIHVSPREFALQADGTGGLVIDTASYITHLIGSAYRELVVVLDAYMTRVGNRRELTGHATDKCYTKGRGPQSNQLPSVILHFTGGACLDVPPKNVFFNIGRLYCLAMQESDNGFSILGSYQQSNMRFIYDRGQKLLRFRPENCGGQ